MILLDADPQVWVGLALGHRMVGPALRDFALRNVTEPRAKIDQRPPQMRQAALHDIADALEIYGVVGSQEIGQPVSGSLHVAGQGPGSRHRQRTVGLNDRKAPEFGRRCAQDVHLTIGHFQVVADGPFRDLPRSANLCVAIAAEDRESTPMVGLPSLLHPNRDQCSERDRHHAEYRLQPSRSRRRVERAGLASRQQTFHVRHAATIPMVAT